MIDRLNFHQKPLMQSIVEHNPFSMLFSLASCIAWTGFSVSSGSPYAIFPAMQTAALLYGFGMEFKRLAPNPVKIKNHFKDEKYYLDGQLAAELRNENNSTPVLEIYSSDPAIIGFARGHLLGRDYIEMRKTYLPFLFANAQLVIGPRLQDAVTTVNQKTHERGINTQYKMRELHYFLLKANEAVIEYNLQRPAILHVPYVTIDELLALNHFGDIEKGLVIGCSVAYIANEKTSIRNFDWPSAGDLFNHFTRSTHRTSHTEPNKPQYVTSWTLPPNPGLQGTNGRLFLAMNEVEKHSTMRKNPKGGFGQFDLFNMILENCCSIKEIEEFIEQHPPASPWILNVATENGGGIFEMLPTLKTDNPPLFRFIEAAPYCLSTNHFQELPETAAVSCSVTRYEKMKSALETISHDPWKIAASSATNDTGQTLIAKWHDKKLFIQSNIANFNSAIATDPEDNRLHYDELDVHEHGNEFLKKCSLNLVQKQTSPADQALMDLCQASYKVKDYAISQTMREIYSQLMAEKTKYHFGHQEIRLLISMENIESIARKSKDIVNFIMNANESQAHKIKMLEDYEKEINELSNSHLTHSISGLQIMLGMTIFTGMMAVFCSDTLGVSLLASGLTWLATNLSASTAIYTASAPLRNALKNSPDVSFFAHSMVDKLRANVDMDMSNVSDLTSKI